MRFTCPVCGYPNLVEVPRPAIGGGSFEICPSCGFQFGVTDDDSGKSFEEWRRRWIDSGMAWWSPARTPPPTWDPQLQLAALFREQASPTKADGDDDQRPP